MTEDNHILIRNIYYMLSYAFRELRRNNYENIDKEQFDEVQDLFAEILFRGVSQQLKQGLYREYVGKVEAMPLLRGKLEIGGTIRNKIRHKNLLTCDYDELSENNIFNQIIKTTAVILVGNECVKADRKNQLKRILPFFSGVESLDPFAIKWNRLRFQRSNRTYKMLINICYFVLSGMLLTTETGKYRMATFSVDQMNRLFERFVLEFYKRHHPGLRPNADNIDWDIDRDKPCIIDMLPEMHSDITLHNGDHTLIIDTKFYDSATQTHFDKPTIHSANLYQIYTYVKNRDRDNSGNVAGLLLYAKTDEDIAPDLDATFGKNRIMVKTLDLNREFDDIRRQLDEIADEFVNQENTM